MKVDGGEGEHTKCLSNIRDDLFRDAFSFLQPEGVSLSRWECLCLHEAITGK